MSGDEKNQKIVEDQFQSAEMPLEDDRRDEIRESEDDKFVLDYNVEEQLEKAKAFKKEGNDEFGQGNYNESVAAYTKGLRNCPDSEAEFRSILFANRSAARMKLGLKDDAIKDCTQALEHNPNYVRALLRRAKLYEELEKLEEALADCNAVLQLDSCNKEARLAAQRLPGEINERNEKLKTEMLGKLKDLGNMILRPFGLSTENFQLQQDGSSGGYSVNFKK